MYILITVSVIISVTIAVGYLTFKIQNRPKKGLLEEEYDLKAITIKQIDKMEDGSEFEYYLYRLFLALGYKAYKTVGSGDYGADIVFTDSEGIRNVVQAKRYSEPVGIHAVQQIYGSMRFYKAKRSIVITNSRFTDPCEKLAGYNHVTLLSRNELEGIIKAYREDQVPIARSIIESEPRILLDSWTDYLNEDVEIKKDKKAEMKVNSMTK
ncbi:restriction endonuclease [Paenibacillus sp. SYP-B4298]|uniref:restriction endonuclease n=1 Tax=Paenibacillus sp. SYP-B4298 TaxID=2996034 RepID=UPI0022DE8686|nr:restriction endonuclease [Paenibacillus sp. SYP-B4298]